MVKKFKLLLIVVFLSVSIIQVRAQEEEQLVYTLEQCIEYALANNADVKNAALEKEISDKVVGEIMADGLPQINGSINFTDNLALPLSYLPADFVPGTPDGVEEVGVPFGTKYSGNAAIGLRQMIFNGSYFVGLKAAKTYTELSRKEMIRTEIDIREAVTKAYYIVLVSQVRKGLIERNYERLDTLTIETQAMFDAGLAESIDVSRVKVQRNNLKADLRNIDQEMALSYSLLKFQMGMSVASSLEVADRIEDLRFEMLEEELSKSYDPSNRIEFSIIETNMDLVNLDIKNVNSRYIPTIDLFGNVGSLVGTSGFSNFLKFGDRWSGFAAVGLDVNIPIFDGLRKSKQIQQKKLQLKQIDNTKTQLENQIHLQINQARLRLATARDALLIQEESMQLAEEVYRITKIKYQEGVGSSIELMTADSDYKEAQVNFYVALQEALGAKVDLQKALGVLDK